MRIKTFFICFFALLLTFPFFAEDSLPFGYRGIQLGMSVDQVKEALKKLNLEENIRGEKLSIAQFGELSELLLK